MQTPNSSAAARPQSPPPPSSPGARRRLRAGPDTRTAGSSGSIDPRAEHLIALVCDGARLEDAARPYGLSGERVRQILLEAGMTARELPGRAKSERQREFAPACELAPVIEAMWREGMFCHEIAMVFDVSGEAVHELICQRVPPRDLAAQVTWRGADDRSEDERLLQSIRRAATVLADTSGIDPAHRRRAQARLGGWLVAHAQLTKGREAPPEPTGASAPPPTSPQWTVDELRQELERFSAALKAGGLRLSTINAYEMGSSLFVRWLAGEYVPGRQR